MKAILKKTTAVFLSLLLLLTVLPLTVAAGEVEEQTVGVTNNLTVNATSNLFPDTSVTYRNVSKYEDNNGDVFITVAYKMCATNQYLINLHVKELTWDNTVLEFKEAYNMKNRRLYFFPFAVDQGISSGNITINDFDDSNAGRIVGTYSSINPAAYAYEEDGSAITVARAVFKLLNRNAAQTTVDLSMNTLSLDDDTNPNPFAKYPVINDQVINNQYYGMGTYSTVISPDGEESDNESPLTVNATSNFFPDTSVTYRDVSKYEDNNGDVFITVAYKMCATNKYLINLHVKELTWDNTVLEFKEAYNMKNRRLYFFPFAVDQGISSGNINDFDDNNGGRIVGTYTSINPAAYAYEEDGSAITVARAVFKLLDKNAAQTTVDLSMNTLSLDDDTNPNPFAKYPVINDQFINNQYYGMGTYSTVISPDGEESDNECPTVSLSSSNNVSSSQTVTIRLNDNDGIKGYYWGTSSNYANNAYTVTSSTSVTKTVSSSGTYYATAVDTAGNISSTASIRFYKTTLNANGGSVSPTSVLTKSGNSFTFPTPTRTSYSYVGWSTSSSATSGVKTLTPTSNATYYAVWSYVDSQKPTASLSSTNNVASSQTVTISMSDNVGIKGYYWGTSSTYSNNSFTTSSSTSITKTVSSSGTYYVTAVDTSGNISDNKSITFYKTMLNANGGSVSPTSVLTKSGNSFTFPTPTRTSYSYVGWSTSSSATSGVKTLTPTSNATYYAVWSYVDSQKPTASLSSTNNVASSQTVTISMSDNVGIKGYYWGTSSTYSNNSYTTSSSTSITKTVSSSGTYYVTAVDTSGNISDNKSITFYKTTLNANGGSVSPTSVLTKSGNSFTFPTPTRSNYTYVGWSTSSSAASGVKTLTPTSNATYYAVWNYVDSQKPTASLSSTNNVASSQTVTISMSDNVGIKGYYWGTSSTYSSNSYTTSSSTSITKTVSSSGTYYVTAVDTSGNISDNKSITFYKTTLNANGGSVSPTSVLTKSGNSFTFPTPTRSNYTYVGWSTSSSAASGVKSLSPSSNVTYYAVWNNSFTWGRDNWRFNNSGANFGNTYYINSTYYNKLLSGLNRLEADNVKSGLSGTWQGSCYGMAVTSILGYQGILNPSDYTDGAACVNDIASPPSNTVKSLINYYFAVQYTDQMRQKSLRAIGSTESAKINQLLSCLSDDSPTLLCYYWPPTYNPSTQRWYYSGHAVVAYDVEDSSGTTNGFSYNKKILIYDNRLTGFADNRCIYINTNNGSWYLPYDGLSSNNGAVLGLITDSMSDINYHGYINGNNNISIGEYISVLTTAEVSSEITWSKFSDSDSMFNYNSVDDEEMLYFSPITDNNTSSGHFNIGFKDSNSGYSMRIDSPQSQDVSMRYENSLVKINTTNTDYIAFAPNGFSYLEGKNSDYSIKLTFNDGFFTTDWYDFSIDGKSVNKASLTPQDGGYVLEASNLKDVTISAMNDTHTASKTLSTSFSKVFIYEIDEDTIGLKVDTDGNGTYETELLAIGDANLDGRVNVRDVTAIQRHISETALFNEQQIALADINGDGVINIDDATLLQRYLAEYDTTIGKRT